MMNKNKVSLYSQSDTSGLINTLLQQGAAAAKPTPNGFNRFLFFALFAFFAANFPASVFTPNRRNFPPIPEFYAQY
jgi:hypothetical protein